MEMWPGHGPTLTHYIDMAIDERWEEKEKKGREKRWERRRGKEEEEGGGIPASIEILTKC